MATGTFNAYIPQLGYRDGEPESLYARLPNGGIAPFAGKAAPASAGIGLPVLFTALPTPAAVDIGTKKLVSDLSNVGNVEVFNDGAAWTGGSGGIVVYRDADTIANLGIGVDAAAALIALDLGNPLIPAGLLREGSRVNVKALLRKTGTAAAATFDLRFGPAADGNDAPLINGSMSLNNANGATAYVNCDLFVTSTTTGVTAGSARINDAVTGDIAGDVALNTAVANYLTFNGNSLTAPDTLQVLALEVTVFV